MIAAAGMSGGRVARGTVRELGRAGLIAPCLAPALGGDGDLAAAVALLDQVAATPAGGLAALALVEHLAACDRLSAEGVGPLAASLRSGRVLAAVASGDFAVDGADDHTRLSGTGRLALGGSLWDLAVVVVGAATVVVGLDAPGVRLAFRAADDADEVTLTLERVAGEVVASAPPAVVRARLLAAAAASAVARAAACEVGDLAMAEAVWQLVLAAARGEAGPGPRGSALALVAATCLAERLDGALGVAARRVLAAHRDDAVAADAAASAPAAAPVVTAAVATFESEAELPEATVAALMRSLPGRFRAERAEGFAAVYHYLLEEADQPEWTVSVADDRCTVSEGLVGRPDCVVRMRAATYLAIESGELAPQTAFLTGRAKVSNVAHMMRAMKLFRSWGRGR
jgi:putative sterol carrier protein